VNISPEAAELRHDYRRFEAASMGEGRGELGATVQRSITVRQSSLFAAVFAFSGHCAAGHVMAYRFATGWPSAGTQAAA
jgi:hypothetical protein